MWKLCLNRGNAVEKSACGKYVQNTALLSAHLLYSIKKLGKYKTRFLMEE